MSKIIALDAARRSRRVENRHQAREGIVSGAAAFASAPVESPLPPRRAGDTRLAVSIVVPTRGRAHMLNRCMASLVLQRYDPNRFEIIIVDDGPDDETREVVTSWAAHCAQSGPEIVYIPSMGPHGPAAARNHGWRAARAELVAFTDDDTIARADWLRNGLRAFGEDVNAVWGRIVMPLAGTPTDYELDAKGLERAEFVTANCFVRKRTLEEVGGFDERFRFAWREDSDLYFRLLEYRRHAIVHEPAAVIMHPIRPAHWGVSLSQVKKVQFDALLYKKHPEMYRRKIRATPRWDFYLTVGALLLALVFLILSRPVPAVLFGSIWGGMTLRFCLHRLRHTSKAPLHVLEMLVTSALIPPLALFWRAVGALRYRVAFI